MLYCDSCGAPVAATASNCGACGALQRPTAQAHRSTGGLPPVPGSPKSGVTPAPAAASVRAFAESLRLSREEWILVGATVALFIDLLALPWFEASAGFFTFTLTATQQPDGWLGVLAVLGCAALIADLLVERLSPQTTLPMIRSSRSSTRLAVAGATAACVALKFVLHVHFSLFGAGFYIAVILLSAMLVTARRLSGVTA